MKDVGLHMCARCVASRFLATDGLGVGVGIGQGTLTPLAASVCRALVKQHHCMKSHSCFSDAMCLCDKHMRHLWFKSEGSGLYCI